MAVSSGDAAKEFALHNFEGALDMAWENRYRVFSNPGDLQSFIEDLARQVNHGLLKDGVLYRTADSAKYGYTPAAQIEASAAWFYRHLFSLLCREPYDPVWRRQPRNTISISRAISMPMAAASAPW